MKSAIKMMKEVIAAPQGKKSRIFETYCKENACSEVLTLQMLSTLIETAQQIGDNQTDFEMSLYATLVMMDMKQEDIEEAKLAV